MRKLFYLLLVVSIISMLAITACGKDDDNITNPFEDITPANTDWDVFFWDSTIFTKADSTIYYITCNWLGATTGLTSSDVISMIINDVAYPLEGSFWGGNWVFDGEAFLLPGQVYSVELFKNGTRVAKKDIRMPFQCHAVFPATFNPAQSHTVGWTKDGTNQFQYFSGWSSAGGDYSEYDVMLASNVTTHTMPANTLQSFGDNTYYSVMISQLSYVRDGRTAFIAESGHSKNYSNYPTKEEIQFRQRMLRQKISAAL